MEDLEAKDSPNTKKDRSTCQWVVRAGKICKKSVWDARNRKLSDLGRSDVLRYDETTDPGSITFGSLRGRRSVRSQLDRSSFAQAERRYPLNGYVIK